MFEDKFCKSADGLALHYRDYASDGAAGSPVLCLPGLTRNLKDFEDVAPRIAARGRRVLALSFRGRGRSAYDPNTENYFPTKYAEDALSVLDAEGVSAAVFLGTSNGGITSLVVAATAPERMRAVILNDIGPEIDEAGLNRIRSYAGQPTTISGWADAAAYARATNKIAFPAYTDEDWIRFARRLFSEDSSGAPVLDYDPAIGAQVRADRGPAPDLWPLFDALGDAPTLVLRGALSDILSRETIAQMQARKPDLVTAEIPAVGHAPMLDELAALAALAAFLATVA